MKALVPATEIADISVMVADINSYWFLGVSGSVTVKGFFVNEYNNRLGASFTFSVPIGSGSNNPVNLVTGSGLTVDENTVGAILSFSGQTYFDLSVATSADFKANYANYPQMDISTRVPLGRVNVN